MADARIFFSNPNIPRTMGSLTVTAWESESHDRSNNVTSYPVENGAEISDHIQPQPIELSVSGIVEAIDTGANIVDAFLTLEEIMAAKEVITIVTGLKVYENMAVLSSNVTRTALNGGSLSFTASLRQISLVSSQAITIANNILADNNVQSQAMQNIGKVTSGQTQQSDTNEFNSFVAGIYAEVDAMFGIIQQ